MAPGSESGTEPAASWAVPAGGDGDAAGPGERGEQLGEVERVARRAGGQPQQPGVRPPAGQRADQLGHGRLRAARRAGSGASSSTARRSASRSSRCGAGRVMPMSSSGTWRAVRARRPQSLTVAGSAHCRSSMTSTTGRAAVSSMVSAMSCSASIAGTSAPRSVATSPRSSPAIVVRRAFADGAAHPQRVEERQQRQLLAELVARRPRRPGSQRPAAPRCLARSRARCGRGRSCRCRAHPR